MIKIVFVVLLFCFCSGCSYVPQALKPDYYKQSFHEMKGDVDDVVGARTLSEVD